MNVLNSLSVEASMKPAQHVSVERGHAKNIIDVTLTGCAMENLLELKQLTMRQIVLQNVKPILHVDFTPTEKMMVVARSCKIALKFFHVPPVILEKEVALCLLKVGISLYLLFNDLNYCDIAI